MKINNKRIQRLFRLDLQNRLVFGFLIATCLTGLFATIISIWTINRNTIAEVQNRVRMDINTAKLIYNNKIEKITSLIQFTAEGSDLSELINRHDISSLSYMKGLIRSGTATQPEDDHITLDMLTLVDTGGNVLYRAANPAIRGDNLLKEPIVRDCIEKKISLYSTELMSIKDILRENPALSDRAETKIVKTPLSADIKEDKLSEGMVMKAAYPIIDRNSNLLVGVLVGGVLINKEQQRHSR